MASPEPSATGSAFLSALGDPSRAAIRLRTAIVVAHPDDETIGCGAQLGRLAELTIIHVTDGAPRNGVDAEALGFSGPASYAAARRAELESAVAVAGVGAGQLVGLNWPDQEASEHLVEIAASLASRLRDTQIVVTHAYEGGHPDHDATALAVHAACSMIGREATPPEIVEVPLYRAGPDGWIVQSFFSEPGRPETVVELGEAERQLKRRMFAAHLSQVQVLASFAVERERFRLAPRYDFAKLPPGEELYYERESWGMTSARWLEHARHALDELALERPAWA